ncbi:MAG: hypothetical protein ABW360_05525 [Phenylobacterium sp.]
MNADRTRKRFMLMAGVNAAAVLVAIAGAVGFFVYGVDWALGVFAAALVAGFAAQIWFILGLGRTDKGV